MALLMFMRQRRDELIEEIVAEYPELEEHAEALARGEKLRLQHKTENLIDHETFKSCEELEALSLRLKWSEQEEYNAAFSNAA